MMRFRMLLVLMIAALLCPRPSQAEEGIVGVWRQIRSNAGECPTCRIEIAKGDMAFEVKANNGWAGSVRANPGDDLNTAAGGGRWRPGGASPHGGKFFRMNLIVHNSLLYLLMRGTGFQVEAVFERARPDNI